MERDWKNLTKEAFSHICYPKPGQQFHIHTCDVEFLFDLLHQEKPKTIVEIGAAYGTSSKMFAGFLKGQEKGKLYSIDPFPKKEWFDNMVEEDLLTHAEIIHKASPWVSWDGGPVIDLLFVDGWHNFRNVFVDYFYWERYVREGGVIVFHDTELFTSVKRAIKEIKRTELLELIGSCYGGITGIEAYRKLPQTKGRVVFFGPWSGELGWEVAWWQGFCRKQAHDYDYSIVSTFPGHEGLYEDFASEIIPHNLRGNPLCGHLNNITGDFEYPSGLTRVFTPPISDNIPNEDQEFIRFGQNHPNHTYDILLHMNERSVIEDWRWYPIWKELVTALLEQGYSIACFGKCDKPEEVFKLGQDGYDERTDDLRNIPLSVLMQHMAGCKVVVGPASGLMHLANYCDSKTVVWCDTTTWSFGQTLRQRYEVILNPHDAITCIIDQYHNWQPPIEVVLNAVKETIQKIK